MTLRFVGRDLLDMEDDIGRGVKVEVAIDSRGVRFTVSIEGNMDRELFQAAYMLSRHEIFYLNEGVKILPEIADQLRKKIQKERFQDSE